MTYDTTILADTPILYLPGTQATDRGSGAYPIFTHGSPVASGVLPNGEAAWHFDSTGTQFLSVTDPADGSLSINKTGKLTVEFWMQLDAVNQPHNAPGLNGGCEILGKSVSNNTPQVASDGCEYLFRYYSADSTDGGNTPTDVCFYAFNKSCGFGAGNDDHIDSTQGYTKNSSDWYYWCGVYDTTPATISPYGSVTMYGGIYGNGKWNGIFLNRAGLQVMWASGQPIIRPTHTTTPLTIGACGLSSSNFAPEGTESYFNGKIGKFAIYNYALSPTTVKAHFDAMSGGVTPPPPPPPPPVTTVPGTPVNVSASAGNASAKVSWTAPSSGGSAITSYTVTPYAGLNAQSPVLVGGTSVTITGLVNGTAYTFKVKATNSVGTGLSSAASNTVIPVSTPPPSGAPASPTSVLAVAGNGSAVVSWTPPPGTVTSYTVVPFHGTTGGAGHTVFGTTVTTLTGLSNGTSYTFKVSAANSSGTSGLSLASNAVTPSGTPPPPPPPPPTHTYKVTVAGVTTTYATVSSAVSAVQVALTAAQSVSVVVT